MEDLDFAVKCLERLEKTPKRNEKKKILLEARDNSVLREFFSKAYDWKKTYGLVYKEPKKLLKIKSAFSPSYNTSEEWKIFISLLENLASRKLSGISAINSVSTFLKAVPPHRAIWYIRTINRDLRIGVNSKTFGEIWPDLRSSFSVSLADKFNSNETNLNYPIAVEPKYDGLRITLIFEDGKGVGKTRSGKEYNEILKHILEELGPLVVNGAVDGEIYADWSPKGNLSAYGGKLYKSPWGKTSAMLKTGYANGVFQEDKVSPKMWEDIKRDLKFWAFDFMNLEVYDPEIAKDSTPFSIRRANLEKLINSLKQRNEKPATLIMPQRIANNRIELEEAHSKNMALGHEGSMLKELNAPYYPKRSSVMLKWKEDEFIDGVILEVLPGTGRNESWAGAYRVRLKNGMETRCNVLGDTNRKEHWERRQELVGTVIEMTQQKDAKAVSQTARFPVFTRLRDDLPKEDI